MIAELTPNNILLSHIEETFLTSELSSDGIIIDANQKFCALFGLSTYDIIGQKYSDFLTNGAEESILNGALKQAIKGNAWSGEYKLDTGESGVKSFKSKIYPTYSNEHNKRTILILHEDITPLNQLLEQNKALFVNHPDAMIVCDANFQLVECNLSSERIFGYNNTEMLQLGLMLSDLVFTNPSQNYNQIETAKDNAMAHGISSTANVIGLRKEGVPVRLKITISPYQNHQVLLTIISTTNEDPVENRFMDALNTSWLYAEFSIDSEIKKINPHFLRFLGYCQESEVIGKHHDILCESSYLESQEYITFWKELREGKIQSGEFKRINRHGDEVWVYASYTPVYNDQGEIIKIMKIAADITGTVTIRKKMNTIAKSRKETLNKAVDSIITFNEDLTITFFNESACGMFGYDVNEVIGQRFYNVVKTKSGPQYKTPLEIEEYLSNQLQKSNDFEYLTTSGSAFWGYTSLSKIETERGTEYTTFIKDITKEKGYKIILEEKNNHLKKTLVDLQESQNQLIESEKLASLGHLIAGIAHEINTPLGAINASVGSLGDSFWKSMSSLANSLKYMNQDVLELLSKLIQQGSTNIKMLTTREARAVRRSFSETLTEWEVPNSHAVSDLLVDMNITEGLEDYRKLILHENSEEILSLAYHLINQTKARKNIEIAIDKVRKTVYALKSYSHFNHEEEKVPTNLAENIETVLVLYQNHLKQGVKVIREYDTSIPLIDSFPDELIQVWTNVIHNSIQAMENKGEITINMTQDDKNVMVSIADNGPGIPEKIQPQIFDAFFTTKGMGEGSGLGLDIVRKILIKHHGTIDFESDQNGTTFFINLPK